jgi:IstB-like ATP binding protein
MASNSSLTDRPEDDLPDTEVDRLSPRLRRWWRNWPRHMPTVDWRNALTHFAKPKLLIRDDPGHLPFEPDASHLFFQLVSRRYERGAMLVTSNRAVGEWGPCSGIPWWRRRSSIACFTTATS